MMRAQIAKVMLVMMALNMAVFMFYSLQISKIQTEKTELELEIRTLRAPVDTAPDVTRYFVGVKSSNGNVENRQSLRNGWLRYFTEENSVGLSEEQKKRFSYKFFVGAPSIKKCVKFSNCSTTTQDQRNQLRAKLQEEQYAFDDLIVLEDVGEFYGNLSRKMMGSFKWAVQEEARQGRQFSHYIGVDDDVYVRLDLLEKDLAELQKNKLYYGRFHRNIQAKGSIYPFNRFPSFVTGMSYVISMDLVRWIVYNSDKLTLFPHDDCGLAIWILPLPKKMVDKGGAMQYRGGACTETLIAQHPITTTMQHLYEEHQKHLDQFCPPSKDFYKP